MRSIVADTADAEFPVGVKGFLQDIGAMGLPVIPAWADRSEGILQGARHLLIGVRGSIIEIR